jgi:threonine/homoserine/homoserine lactone efflux protein
VAAFLLVSIALIVTPGQDTLLTVRNTVIGGRPGGLLTACGVAVGQLTWTAIVTVGVAALLVTLPSAVSVLTLGGAVYLVYLGIQYLREASRDIPALMLSGNGMPSQGGLTFFRQGLISNLGNPKMLMFFTSLLPSFARDNPGLPLAALGALFSVLTLGWLSCYAAAIAMLGSFLARPGVRRTVNLVAGTALLVVGVSIAAATYS